MKEHKENNNENNKNNGFRVFVVAVVVVFQTTCGWCVVTFCLTRETHFWPRVPSMGRPRQTCSRSHQSGWTDFLKPANSLLNYLSLPSCLSLSLFHPHFLLPFHIFFFTPSHLLVHFPFAVVIHHPIGHLEVCVNIMYYMK